MTISCNDSRSRELVNDWFKYMHKSTEKDKPVSVTLTRGQLELLHSVLQQFPDDMRSVFDTNGERDQYIGAMKELQNVVKDSRRGLYTTIFAVVENLVIPFHEGGNVDTITSVVCYAHTHEQAKEYIDYLNKNAKISHTRASFVRYEIKQISDKPSTSWLVDLKED